MSVVGDDPVYLLTAIIPATATAAARAGLSIDVIDAFEVNEAFASEVPCWLADTAADRIAQTAAAMLLEVKLEPIFHRGQHKLPDTPCPNAQRVYSGSSSRPRRWIRPRFSE
jgi:Thiolase, C-terminal domain